MLAVLLLYRPWWLSWICIHLTGDRCVGFQPGLTASFVHCLQILVLISGYDKDRRCNFMSCKCIAPDAANCFVTKKSTRY